MAMCRICVVHKASKERNDVIGKGEAIPFLGLMAPWRWWNDVLWNFGNHTRHRVTSQTTEIPDSWLVCSK